MAVVQDPKTKRPRTTQTVSLPVTISSGRILLRRFFQIILFLTWTGASILILAWMYFRVEQRFENRSTPTWIAALPAFVFVASGSLFPSFRRFIIPPITPAAPYPDFLVAAIRKRRSICYWKCCCGRTFFADFMHAEAAMKEVDALARVYGKAFLLVPSDSALSAVLQGRRSREAGEPKYSTPCNSSELGSKNLWVLACFQSSKLGTIAFHERLSKLTYDSEILTRFRELYFRERSWIKRFFDMTEVKKISVVNFDLLPLDRVNNIRKNYWPLTSDRNWAYTPSHEPQPPRLKQQLLMHLWRNPHHADRAAYQEWKNKSSVLTQVLEWLRLHNRPRTLLLSLGSYKVYQSPQTALRKVELQQFVPFPRSSIIFDKIPKKVGDKLVASHSERASKGWGVLFEEGLRAHRLHFVCLLCLCLFGFVFLVRSVHTFDTNQALVLKLIGTCYCLMVVFTQLCVFWYTWAESS